MKLVSYIAFEDANQALDFYESALGATGLERVLADEGNIAGLGVAFEEAQGKVMHGAFEILGQPVFCSDVFGNDEVTRNLSLVFRVDGENAEEMAQARELFNRAEAADCQMIMPLQETFWTKMYGMFKDPFGVKWMVSAE